MKPSALLRPGRRRHGGAGQVHPADARRRRPTWSTATASARKARGNSRSGSTCAPPSESPRAKVTKADRAKARQRADLAAPRPRGPSGQGRAPCRLAFAHRYHAAGHRSRLRETQLGGLQHSSECFGNRAPAIADGPCHGCRGASSMRRHFCTFLHTAPLPRCCRGEGSSLGKLLSPDSAATLQNAPQAVI